MIKILIALLTVAGVASVMTGGTAVYFLSTGSTFMPQYQIPVGVAATVAAHVFIGGALLMTRSLEAQKMAADQLRLYGPGPHRIRGCGE